METLFNQSFILNPREESAAVFVVKTRESFALRGFFFLLPLCFLRFTRALDDGGVEV